MKVKESYWHEAAKDDKKNIPKQKNVERKQAFAEQLDAAAKFKKTENPLKKEENIFADIQTSLDKSKKPNQRRDNASENRSGDQKNEKSNTTREKDSAESLSDKKNTDKYESSGGQTGGQGGFDMNSNIKDLSLSNNFAARSILHIADLERLISTIRTQTGLGGRREIVLQLKNSVLEGLQVKVITDPAAKVQIEFLAANEKVRAEIVKHTAELSKILNGRGINLEAIKTTLASSDNQDREEITPQINESVVLQDADNTFIANKNGVDRTYKA